MKINLENIRISAFSVLIIAILFQLSCSIHKSTTKSNISNAIKELHFVRTHNLTEKGGNNLDSLEQVILEELREEHPERVKAFPHGFFSMMVSDLNSAPFLISITDTLWKTNLYDNNVSYRYDTIEKKSYVYPNKNEPYTNVIDYTDFDTTQLLSYTEHRNDKMSILGFECFKVLFSIKENIDDANSGFGMGNDIFEMYVTEDIELPMSMIMPYQIPRKQYFPLHVERWPSCCKGVDEITSLEKIIYKE